MLIKLTCAVQTVCYLSYYRQFYLYPTLTRKKPHNFSMTFICKQAMRNVNAQPYCKLVLSMHNIIAWWHAIHLIQAYVYRYFIGQAYLKKIIMKIDFYEKGQVKCLSIVKICWIGIQHTNVLISFCHTKLCLIFTCKLQIDVLARNL